MVSRVESAAATRAALVQAANHLLDAGGPQAVTLRAVGASAGVSRGAPYGHFADKEHLLTRLAIDAWEELAAELRSLATDRYLEPLERLERALVALVALARRRPHLYALMYSTPAGDPTAALRAAGGAQDVFLELVADAVGGQDTRRYGALLLSSAHGVAAMELSGHLSQQKWNVTSDELLSTLVQAVHHSARV